MLTIALASVFSALMFRATARRKGYYQVRLWTYPLVVGSVFFAVELLVGIVGGWALRRHASSLMQAYPFVMSWAAILLMFAVLAKAWRQLQALPPWPAIPSVKQPATTPEV